MMNREIIRTVELEPLQFPSGDSLQLRIEIQPRWGEPRTFRAFRVFRVEAFELAPGGHRGPHPSDQMTNRPRRSPRRPRERQ